MTGSTRIQPLRLLLGAGVLLAITAGAVWGIVQLTMPPTITSQQGTVLDPPRPIGEFALTGTDGDPITQDVLLGNYTLMSFGYTHCPDVCPLTLTEFKRVKRELGDAAERVNFVFVSVDGERDTPDLLGRYLERFDPAFVGMTTTDEAALNTVTDMFNVFYERREVEGTQASYLVDHTASLFLLDPRGRLIVLYSFGTPPVDIAADIQALL